METSVKNDLNFGNYEINFDFSEYKNCDKRVRISKARILVKISKALENMNFD